MFDIPTVQECLKNRVGFKQPDDPTMNRIYDDLTVSESGIYFQGIHPLVNLENLKNIAPQFDKYVHAAYNIATTYSQGNRVSSGGKVYESLVDSNTGNAVTDATKWEEIDLFSEWLERLRNDASIKVINQALSEKKIRGEVKSIFEDLNLFEGNGRATDLILKEGRFVFWEIESKADLNLSVVLQSVWTQLNAANGAPLNLYIYHSSQWEPIYVKTLTLDKAYSFYKTALEGVDLTYYGGSYYVGYYEDDLTTGVQAIKKYNYTLGVEPCACNPPNHTRWESWSKYVTYTSGYISASNINEDRTLFDVSKIVYTPDVNYGLNFGLTVECDLSRFICNNRALFDNAIALQVGVDVLQEIAFSTRNNAISKEKKSEAMFALDNRDNYSQGLVTKLDKAIKSLDFDMSELGECMPKVKAVGVRSRAI